MRLEPNTSAVKDTPKCISADGSIRYAPHQSQISTAPLQQDKNRYVTVQPVEVVRARGSFQSMGWTLKRAMQNHPHTCFSMRGSGTSQMIATKV